MSSESVSHFCSGNDHSQSLDSSRVHLSVRCLWHSHNRRSILRHLTKEFWKRASRCRFQMIRNIKNKSTALGGSTDMKKMARGADRLESGGKLCSRCSIRNEIYEVWTRWSQVLTYNIARHRRLQSVHQRSQFSRCNPPI